MPSLISKIKTRWNNFTLEGYENVQKVQKIIDEPNFPFLVSFPRTGSHWFRFILEKYSDRPLLIRSFFNHNNSNYLLFHTHDLNLNTQKKKVVYLYRNPTDVIYSQLNYYNQNINDKNLIHFWTQQYTGHLIHWLFNENFTEKKLIIKYENLQNDLSNEFQKVCSFFDLNWDEKRLIKIASSIDKEAIKKKTYYDDKIIPRNKDYQKNKIIFKESYELFIQNLIIEYSNLIFKDEQKLASLFN